MKHLRNAWIHIYGLMVKAEIREEKMKYYEFNNAEYYALIRANSEQQAIDHYCEIVTSKVDGEKLQPDVITKTEAKARYDKAIQNDPNPDDRADAKKVWASKEAPFLLLIAADLY